MDLKSIGLCPRRFEPCSQRISIPVIVVLTCLCRHVFDTRVYCWSRSQLLFSRYSMETGSAAETPSSIQKRCRRCLFKGSLSVGLRGWQRSKCPKRNSETWLHCQRCMYPTAVHKFPKHSSSVTDREAIGYLICQQVDLSWSGKFRCGDAGSEGASIRTASC